MTETRPYWCGRCEKFVKRWEHPCNPKPVEQKCQKFGCGNKVPAGVTYCSEYCFWGCD